MLSHVYLEDSLVHFPNKNYVYYLEDPSLNSRIKITFSGDNVSDYIFFDLASGISNKQGFLFPFSPPQLELVTKESLPPTWRYKLLPPILVLSKAPPYTNAIIQPKEIEIQLNRLTNTNGREIVIDYKDGLIFDEIKKVNEFIKNKFQPYVPNVPIKTGSYPLFMDEHRPSADTLGKIYQDFLIYNDQGKLIQQYNNTKSHCHIRAHFVSTLLNQYGIQTFKIYKIWRGADWKKFVIDKSWRFHCAVMMIDNKGQELIWDPWVGANKYLLTLKQWVIRNDEPTPMMVSITNPAIIDDYCDGLRIEATHFIKTQGPSYIKSFQAIADSALPNPPERPLALSLNNNHLFFSAKKNKKQDEEKRLSKFNIWEERRSLADNEIKKLDLSNQGLRLRKI